MMRDDFNFEGKVALVCGASGGIGRSIAMELAALGASVIALARNEEKLQNLMKSLPLDYNDQQKHHFIAADLGDYESLSQKLVPYLKAESGIGIDILINNAGGPKGGPLENASSSDYITGFKQHVLAAQALAKLVIPGMKEKGFGRIINIISTSVRSPIDGLGVSNTIRGAVANWAKTMSREFGPYGITVNSVLPGFTQTDRLDSLFFTKAKKLESSLEEVQEAALRQIPCGRFGRPEETAKAVCFLASRAANYINGVALPVDGGRLTCY